MTKSKTIKYYDDNAYSWASTHKGFEDESFWKKEMNEFHKLLPQGKVIEIGSGSGKDAVNLIKLGYTYTGTDASVGLLELAKKRNPHVVFNEVPAQDLKKEFSQSEFDGFWTAETLLHIPKNEIGMVLDNIHYIVRNQGIGFISIKQGIDEKEDETGRLFTYYSQHEFASLLTQHKFVVLSQEIQPVSENTTWLKYLVKVEK